MKRLDEFVDNYPMFRLLIALLARGITTRWFIHKVCQAMYHLLDKLIDKLWKK